MSDTFQIIDESSDRKYFSMIPNFIVNHSTLEERGFYLTLKRIAGENGEVTMTARNLADACGVSKDKVYRLYKKLLKRGWIKEGRKIEANTKPRQSYVIVDLWELNMKYYSQNKPKPKSDNSIIHNEVFEYWNGQDPLITHKKLTDGIKRKINGKIRDGYNLQDFRNAIANYSMVLSDGKKYWFNYRWTLQDFIQRGMEKFLERKVVEENYVRNAINKNDNAAPSGKYDSI